MMTRGGGGGGGRGEGRWWWRRRRRMERGQRVFALAAEYWDWESGTQHLCSKRSALVSSSHNKLTH
jgi:hypothetical protein